eukprot:1103894-Prymnesium_polylepis.1
MHDTKPHGVPNTVVAWLKRWPTRWSLAGARTQVRCIAWDWSQPEPPAIAWNEITLCIASEVVYYSEFPNQVKALAAVLGTVLTRCSKSVEVLLLLRVRVHQGEVLNSALVPTDEYDARSSVFDFVENVLPSAGMRAELLPLGSCAEAQSARGLRMYRVFFASEQEEGRSPRGQVATVPSIDSAEERRALTRRLQVAWEWQRRLA